MLLVKDVVQGARDLIDTLNESAILCPESYLLDNSLLSLFEYSPHLEKEIQVQSKGDISLTDIKDKKKIIAELEYRIRKLLFHTDTDVKNVLNAIAKDMTSEEASSSSRFTFEHFQEMKESVKNPSTLLISESVWVDIISDKQFSYYFEPTTHYMIMHGVVGKLDGLTLKTDCYRFSTERILQDGDAYVISEPHILGFYSYSDVALSDKIAKYSFGLSLNNKKHDTPLCVRANFPVAWRQ